LTRQLSALFDSHERAAAAVAELRQHHFSERELTVVGPAAADRIDARERMGEPGTQPEARHGTWIGSALGAAVGGFFSLVSMALIPAVPIFVVGGAAVVGAIGSLTGLGVDSQHLQSVESALRAGQVLLLVEQETDERTQEAKDVIERHGPASLTLSS
jgi:uncharacterized membrane protein